MSNEEHYFENLLFHGKDCNSNCNKNSLTPEAQRAIEICANYVIYTTFGNRENFLRFIESEDR